jgi:hypothetical protein
MPGLIRRWFRWSSRRLHPPNERVSYSKFDKGVQVFIYRRLDVNLVEIFYVNLQAAVIGEGFVRRAHFRRTVSAGDHPPFQGVPRSSLARTPETCTGSQPKMPEFRLDRACVISVTAPLFTPTLNLTSSVDRVFISY